ncbi:acetolactate synthase large subunit [Neobacillus ginsengisoli]|uniref:Acetolactate synthase-1/2/3 large subunit n=1 Tax=Neobacillus ginsengisoli TaxID=904295 RepID=A0ABT9XTN6_9BACI|nr:acetolactate synthase large subunit [Neobacillus ginsengisoli]MDQ0198748.1 acetolactate synthase-1/2/3 large subunit [Neobacillus ginsengisoli]
MKASDVIVSCLENEGVEYIFGIIGKEVIDLADSLSRSEKITYIPVRHEQGAAFIADVYGRVSGKPGVCLATLGPGAANLLTGISSANLDHSPVIALTGQKSLESQHQNAHQYIDISKVYEPATKWAVQLKDANAIPEIIRKSFKIAMGEKPGAVVIEIPENIAVDNVTTKVLPLSTLPKSVPAKESLELAVKFLNESKQPFIIVGNGVVRQEAVKEVQTFLDQLACPVTHSFMAKGILAKDQPQNYYTFGFNEKDYVLRGIEESDLLVVIGFDFVEKLPSEWNRKKVPVLHIDNLPAEVNEGYPVKAELVGNLKETLQLFVTSEITSKPWLPSGDLKKRIEAAFSINEEPNVDSSLTIEKILHVVERVQSDRTLVIADVGSHKVSIARTYQPKHANQLIISNGLASMGISIPGAIGAKLASPEKTVICITGDGGALMTFAELETAKRLGLSFIIILLNDSMLKIEDEMMKKEFGESYGVTFTNPDFITLAKSFGVKGMKPKDIVEFEAMLSEAVGLTNEIVLIEAVLQQKS